MPWTISEKVWAERAKIVFPSSLVPLVSFSLQISKPGNILLFHLGLVNAQLCFFFLLFSTPYLLLGVFKVIIVILDRGEIPSAKSPARKFGNLTGKVTATANFRTNCWSAPPRACWPRWPTLCSSGTCPASTSIGSFRSPTPFGKSQCDERNFLPKFCPRAVSREENCKLNLGGKWGVKTAINSEALSTPLSPWRLEILWRRTPGLPYGLEDFAQSTTFPLCTLHSSTVVPFSPRIVEKPVLALSRSQKYALLCYRESTWHRITQNQWWEPYTTTIAERTFSHKLRASVSVLISTDE